MQRWLTLRMPSCMKVSPPGRTLWSSSRPLRMRSLSRHTHTVDELTHAVDIQLKLKIFILSDSFANRLLTRARRGGAW